MLHIDILIYTLFLFLLCFEVVKMTRFVIIFVNQLLLHDSIFKSQLKDQFVHSDVICF